MRWVLLARGSARFDFSSSLARPRTRFDGLLALFTLAGCYAVPSEHDITTSPLADASSTVDAEADPDAALDEDADAGEGEVDGATPNDAGMDARVDAGKDGAVEAGSEAGPADAGPDAEASVCGTCPDAAPACAVTTAQCVACVADDAGACVGKLCSSNNTCIECRENAHCKKPDASVCNIGTGICVPCAEGSDTQCSHIDGKGVCSAGQCIQCRKDKAAACVIGGTQYVCDPTTRACDPQRKARSKTLCNACVSSSDSLCKDRPDCVSDDECQVGQACVNVPAGAGKKVCQQVIGNDACTQPYTSATNAVPSADGPSVRVCTFAATTTCLAHAHYRVKRCGTPDSANAAQDLAGTGDDTKCGEPNLSDGYCTYSDALKQYLCTVPCNATYLDCPGAWLPEHCDTLPTPDRCTW